MGQAAALASIMLHTKETQDFPWLARTAANPPAQRAIEGRNRVNSR